MDAAINIEATVKARINAWLDGEYDENTKAEIRRMLEEDPQAANEAFYKELEFGTGGLRGLMGVGSNRMNQYTVGAATQGLSNYLKQQFPDQEIKVAVAHDSRNQSSYFARITANVFAANDIKVYLFESLRPTPELSFAIRELGCHSGVVVTASHNPKEYNGYKAYWQDGGQLVPPHDRNVIGEVRKIVNVDEIKFDGGAAKIEMLGEEFDEIYMDKVKALSLSPEAIEKQHDLKIVFTSIHGTAITLVPKLLDKFGFTNVSIVEEQAEPDGDFPTVVYPNPEEAEAMSMALKKAQDIDADILLGCDPDSDRVGIGVKNHKGEFQLLNGNQTGVLLFNYVLERRKAKGLTTDKDFLCKTIVTSELMDDFAKANGVECFNVLTGFKYIAELIKQHEGEKQFIVGGEESYGYLIGDFVRDKDAISSVALLSEMAAFYKNEGVSVFEKLLDLYVEYGFYYERLKSVTKKGMDGAAEIGAMMERLRKEPPATINGAKTLTQIDYQTGYRKDLQTGQEVSTGLPLSNVLQFYTQDGSKISARPSGTEPKIKFYFSVKGELKSRQEYDNVFDELNARIDAIIADMAL